MTRESTVPLRTKRAMLEGDEHFRMLADSAPALIWIASTEGTEFVNRGYLDFLGADSGDVRGYDWTRFVHPEDREAYLNAYLQAMEQRVAFEAECRVRRYDGEFRWMRSLGQPLIDASGELFGYSGISIDLTERKRAEEALLEREERYALVLAGSEAAIWDWDVPNKRVHFSPRWKELRGMSDEEVTDGETEWAKGIHPEDAPRVMAAVQAHFDGRSAIFSEEYRVQHKDGHWVWIHDRGIARRDPSGKVVRMAGSEIDITARKRAEQELRHSEQRYRGIFEGAAVAIWEEDFSDVKAALDALKAQGVSDFRRYFVEHPNFVRHAISMVRVVDVNLAAVRLYGAPTREVLMASLDQVFLPESEAVFGEELLALTEGRTFFQSDAAQRTLDGRRLEVLVSIAFPPPDDDFGRALVTIADITERKRAEEARREADRRKDEFIATLSHELRNPLAPLRNSLELARRAELNGDVAELHAIMERQVNHLVRLVDDLLEVSRITRGAVELRREPLELQAVLRNALETAKPLIDAARHRLSVLLPHEPLYMEADPVRLAQVFANLLNNAAKYTPQCGEIVIEARREGAEAVVTVSDTGDGISSEQLSRLFEMFSKGDRTARKSQGGLGVGLALARRLVEMHGGSAFAESEGLGKGSRFTVRLPLGTPSQVSPSEAQSLRRLTQHRVLIVDDNRDAAASLGMLLNVLGAEVRVEYDGPAALETFGRFFPAIVLLDIGMPGMDGYEVASAMRARPNGGDVWLVALTGWGQDSDRKRTKEAGFDYHLVKPADVEAMRSLLSSLESVRSG